MNHLSKVRVLPSLDFISVKCQSKQYEKYCTESTSTLSPLALLKSLKDSALGLLELGGLNHTTCIKLFYLSNGGFGVGPLDIEGNMVCQFLGCGIAAIIIRSAAGVPLISWATILRYEDQDNLNGGEEAESHACPPGSLFANAADFVEKI
jgi:hypothetical protein